MNQKNNYSNLSYTLVGSGILKPVLITDTIPMCRAVCRAEDIVCCNLPNKTGTAHGTEHENMLFSPIAAQRHAGTLVGPGTLKPVLITATIPMFRAVCRVP